MVGLAVTGTASARAPRPPQRTAFQGSFGPPRAPTAKARSLRAARPSSARPARTFRQATDVPQRPASAGAQRSRPAKAKSLTTQRKGKLVNSLRKEQVVNALFLRLQCGGPTDDLKRLARLSQGGVSRAPTALVTLVEQEAYNLLADLEETSPAQTATSARVPGRFSRALSPRGTPRSNNKLSTALGDAHLRILEAVKAEEAAATAATEAAAAADRAAACVSRASPAAMAAAAAACVVPPKPVVVNVCGHNIELQQFLTEKVMARGKSDCANLRHMLLKHDQAKCGAITRAQFTQFLHSVQVFLAPAELEKVFESYGTPDGLINYTGLAAALIPTNYPAPAQKGWINSLPDQVMRDEQAPPKASHLVGVTQEQYDELVVSPRRRRVSTKPPVPRQTGGSTPRSASAARSRPKTAATATERVSVPTAWGALSDVAADSAPKADMLQQVREQLLKKRGGPAQLRRVFQFMTKHGGTIQKAELAECMLSMGMSRAELDAVYEVLRGLGADDRGVTYPQFCEFICGGKDDDFLDRFDPEVYQHHDYTKLQDRMRKDQAGGPAFSHAVAQVPVRTAPVVVGAASLRSLAALERVLRDKAAARSRYISTELRVALQALPRSANGGVSGPDVQAAMIKYGVEISAEDLELIVDRFQQAEDGLIELQSFLAWVLPDDDHDYSQPQSLGPQSRQDNMRRQTPVAHDLPPSRQMQVPTGAPQPPWARATPRPPPSKDAASRHALPPGAVDRVLYEKLAQRHASTPRWTLMNLFRRHGGRADKINYQQFRRLLESLG